MDIVYGLQVKIFLGFFRNMHHKFKTNLLNAIIQTMKKTFFFLAIFLISISFLSAQFEGKVTMTTSSEDGESINFLMKGDQVKIVPDLENQNAAMFMDGKTGDMTIIMEQEGEQFGMKFNLNSNSMISTQMRMAMEKANAKAEDEEVSFNWTGETKTVNGQKCEKVIGKNSQGEFTAWVTKGLGLSFTDLFPIDAPMTNEIKDKLFSSGMEGFPMQVISKDDKGKQTVMNTQVDKMAVSAADVTPNKEIEILDLDNFMQEIMAAQNDPEKMKKIQKKMERFQKMMQN